MMRKCNVLWLVSFACLLAAYDAKSVAEVDLDPEQCAEVYDFDKIIPLSDILNDILIANHYDPEVRDAVAHIASPAFKELTDKLESRTEYQSFMDFCEENDIRLFEVLALLKSLVPALVKASDPETYPEVNIDEIVGGVHGLVMRILLNRIPIEDIRHCIKARMGCDPKFREKMANLHSLKFKALLARLRETVEYQDLVADLEKFQIYFDTYLNVILDNF